MTDLTAPADAPFEPQGAVAVITGAAGGIGLGMARAFAAVGMSVVLSDLDAGRVEESAAALRAAGYDAIGVATDVSKRTEVDDLAVAAMDTHGRVDVLCNNAGVALFSRIEDTSIEDWEWTLGVDLWGPIYGVKAFLPHISKSPCGHINSTSSIAGLVAGAAVAPYNVAKHAVVALMSTLEREFRSGRTPHRASVLCPGPINTGIGANSVRHRRGTGPKSAGTEAGTKLGDTMSSMLAKGMDPDEVGRLVLDGIIERRFWILTHPGLWRHVREQLDTAIENQSLSRGRLV
jgi:NAD(P)-dependent dehydrogenase (short-subunit alcohol dehydrogenase family)